MDRKGLRISLCLFLLFVALAGFGQQAATNNAAVVPPLISSAGTLTDISGKLLTSIVGIAVSQEAAADQSAPQGQEWFVNVSPLFVSNPQPPELIQPSEGPFDYRAPSPRSATMFGVALREPRPNAAGT